MKILQAHNRYRAPGGEDTVLELEHELLRSRGHEVEQFTVSNRDLPKANLRTGIETVWSHRWYKRLLKVLEKNKPDVVHVHNTFPQLSPSVYWAATAQKVPIVQTLHNYRLTCANGLLMRDGVPCELCVGGIPLPALRYKCYRDSLGGTGAVVGMQMVHRSLGTYKNKVRAYIALTQFAKSIMVRSGLPPELVHVKPNFVPDPQVLLGNLPGRKVQLVFVGRLAPEKGVDLLLEAWRHLKPSEFQLTIVGDGPARSDLEQRFANLPGVVWRGWIPREEVLREVARSRYLVMSSRWYEGFPMAVIEALALGTPVIAPNHAAFPEIIASGKTGFLFTPGDSQSLAEMLGQLMGMSVREWLQMSGRAREFYLEHYTPEVNYERLMTIYREAIEGS